MTNQAQFSVEDLQVDQSKREFIAIISTTTVDRVADVMLPSGLVKDNFTKNPVVCVNHDREGTEGLPVGNCLWIKPTPDGKQLIAKFRVSDKTVKANEVYGLITDDCLKAISIGFEPLEQSPPTAEELAANPDWTPDVNVIRKWELHEFSIVTVPCNPDCVIVAKNQETTEEEMWKTLPKPKIVKHIPMPKQAKSLKPKLSRKIASQKELENEILARLLGRP